MSDLHLARVLLLVSQTRPSRLNCAPLPGPSHCSPMLVRRPCQARVTAAWYCPTGTTYQLPGSNMPVLPDSPRCVAEGSRVHLARGGRGPRSRGMADSPGWPCGWWQWWGSCGGGGGLPCSHSSSCCRCWGRLGSVPAPGMLPSIKAPAAAAARTRASCSMWAATSSSSSTAGCQRGGWSCTEKT